MARPSEPRTEGDEARPGRSAEARAPELLASDEMRWEPAPDVFPAGAQLCVLHGDPAAQGETFTVRLKASEQYFFAPHRHPHDEHITIIAGRLKLGNGSTADRDDVRELAQGDYAFLPKEQFHYAWALDRETVFQVQAIGPFGITYARPEDDPRTRGSTH
jgi:quercetin dioxygenase-like cupin family protein